MEASLTCAVCLCLFEDPVTLPLCSHNFCKRCVVECTAPGRNQQPLHSPAGETQVSCPLCRKVSAVAGGVSSLPINTTLAEVVKLIKPGAASRQHSGSGEAEAPGLKGSACPKHPGRFLQLFCKMCRQVACGQCVAEEHKGLFHTINLADIVYQEEKLMFFSNLKKLREVDDRLMKEISVHSNDIEGISKDINAMITTQFDEIYRLLDLKKEHLLKELENGNSKKIKEHQVWKQMKDGHKKTIENFLKDCEEIVDECDPECFLKVACDLNTRIKTQLNLITIASHYKATPSLKPTEIDIKPTLDAISSLHLTGDLNFFTDPFAEKNINTNGKFTFKDSVKQWKEPKNAVSENYGPVLQEEQTLLGGQRICGRYMSISAMTRFLAVSHEELRQKYYETYCQMSTDDKTQTLSKNDTGKSTSQFGLSNMHTTLKITKEGRRLKPIRMIRQTAFDECSASNPERKILDFQSTLTAGRHNEKIPQKMDGIAAISENNLPVQDNVENPQPTPSTISGITQTQSGNPSSGAAVSLASHLTTLNTSSVKEGSTVFSFTSPPSFCFKKVKSQDASVFSGFNFGKSDNENNVNGVTTGLGSSGVSTVPVSLSFTFGNSESKPFTTTKANDPLNVSPFSFFFSQPGKATEFNDMFQTTKKTTESTVRKPEDLTRSNLPVGELYEQTAASTVNCTASKSTVKEETDIFSILPFSTTSLFSSSLNNSLQNPKSTQKFSFGHVVQNVASPVTIAMNSQSKIKPTGMAESVDKQLIPAHTLAVPGLSTYSFTSLGELTLDATTGGSVVQKNSSNSAACNTLFSCLFPSETGNFSSSSSTVSHTKEDGSAAKNSKTQGDLGEFLRQQFGLESSSQVSNDLIPTTYDQPSESSADKMEAMCVLPGVLSDLDESDKETSHSSSITSESDDPNNKERNSFKCTAKSTDSNSIRE
ncbi:uncharacterized protein LOC115461613 isoform X2 [Microcaecilia unicolor]|uniref:Uncharacterized protein LOC115461613 isoform X2 n=1 Tax=Microcaecilia unicolor TaxID=1415580 RepID=A0A6P7XBB9_9AMPH|nr:uncharacterized protein LOC115461613 isoform X2 [Microcaecilia unicolor]